MIEMSSSVGERTCILPNLLPAGASRNGPIGLFSSAFGLVGRSAHDRESPRLTRVEERVGIDLVGPADEVLLRIVFRRAVHGATIGRVRDQVERFPAFERVASRLGFL